MACNAYRGLRLHSTFYAVLAYDVCTLYQEYQLILLRLDCGCSHGGLKTSRKVLIAFSVPWLNNKNGKLLKCCDKHLTQKRALFPQLHVQCAPYSRDQAPVLFTNSNIINSRLRVLKWNIFCAQVLKEAKEVSEQKAAGEPEGTTPTVDLLSEFDKFQGLAHLEALEMLSRDSEAKVCKGFFMCGRYCQRMCW